LRHARSLISCLVTLGMLEFPRDGIYGLLNNFMVVEARMFSCWLLSYRKGNIVMTMSVKLPCGYHVNDCKLSTEREAQC
jgi:hypothetical protein